MTTELVPIEFINKIKLKLLAKHINYIGSLSLYSFNNTNMFGPTTVVSINTVNTNIIELVFEKGEYV